MAFCSEHLCRTVCRPAAPCTTAPWQSAPGPARRHCAAVATRFRRTTQLTWYSPACPHLGQVSVCFRSSVVSLKNSRSSMDFSPLEPIGTANQRRRKPRIVQYGKHSRARGFRSGSIYSILILEWRNASQTVFRPPRPSRPTPASEWASLNPRVYSPPSPKRAAIQSTSPNWRRSSGRRSSHGKSRGSGRSFSQGPRSQGALRLVRAAPGHSLPGRWRLGLRWAGIHRHDRLCPLPRRIALLRRRPPAGHGQLPRRRS